MMSSQVCECHSHPRQLGRNALELIVWILTQIAFVDVDERTRSMELSSAKKGSVDTIINGMNFCILRQCHQQGNDGEGWKLKHVVLKKLGTSKLSLFLFKEISFGASGVSFSICAAEEDSGVVKRGEHIHPWLETACRDLPYPVVRQL